MKNVKGMPVIAFVGIGLWLMVSCSSKDEMTADDKILPVAVTVSKPSGTIEGGVHASGHLEAVETASISTKVMGYITSLNVKVGDQVRPGQVLATINSDDITARRAQSDALVSEAEAHMNSASKDYERFKKLYEQLSASAKEFDDVTLRYNSAKARLEAAKQMRNEVQALMSYTMLTAPFGGIVSQKLADVGSMATPGMPVLVVERTGSLQVNASIPESRIARVKLNDKVRVNIKSMGTEFDGAVVAINRSSQFSGGQYMIKISVPDGDRQNMYAGMYVNVFIATETSGLTDARGHVVLVPRASIVNKDQLKGLYTVSTVNTALLRWVRLGRIFGDDVEVVSGLNKSEHFILQADGRLYNGAPVTIKN